MSSKIPKKKVDFFNGGRGVNLSQFETTNGYSEPESPEIDVEHDPDEPELDHRYYPESDEPASMSPPLYSYPDQSTSPLSPSIPPQYGAVPQGYYPPYSPTDIQSPSPAYLQYGVHSHLQNGSLPPLAQHPISPTHMPPYIPTGSYPGQYPGPSMFTEASYPNQFGHNGYSPLRQMDPNGLHGMSLPNPDGAHGGSMSYEEPSSGTGGESGKRKKRQQKCSLCCNHGVQVDVKGHKWFCPFRNCECERCTITRGRQHHMKEQQKLTRHLQRLQ